MLNINDNFKVAQPYKMKINTFIKSITFIGLVSGIVSLTSFMAISQDFTRNQLIGKENSAIVGDSYTSKMHKEAKSAFLRMKVEAEKQGIQIEILTDLVDRMNRRNNEAHGITPTGLTKKIADIMEGAGGGGRGRRKSERPGEKAAEEAERYRARTGDRAPGLLCTSDGAHATDDA